MSEKEPGNPEQPDNGPKAGVPEDSQGGSPSPAPDDTEPKVVYRRADPKAGIIQSPLSRANNGRARGLAPAIMPLFVGFLLLLILISILGFLSVRRMDEVSVAVLDLEQQHAAK